MIKYPKTIYLFPMDNLIVWDADKGSPEAEGAQEYVRADTLPLPVLPPIPPAGEGMRRYGLQWNGPASPLSTPMDAGYWTPWHLASAENECLRAQVAEKCDAPIGWIGPDKYKAACESKMEFFKTIKELREQNEKLKARVAEQSEVLTDLAVKMKQDFYLDKPTHDAICRAIEDNSEAFIKRKQAEAVNEVAENMCIMPPEASMLVEDLHDLILQEVQRLRSEASKAGGADNAK